MPAGPAYLSPQQFYVLHDKEDMGENFSSVSGEILCANHTFSTCVICTLDFQSKYEHFFHKLFYSVPRNA